MRFDFRCQSFLNCRFSILWHVHYNRRRLFQSPNLVWCHRSGSEKTEVTWGNCISLGVDNTNTNVDEHNSIKSRALKENKSIFIARCNCHLVYLAAGQGGKAYANISGFDMEEHQVDIYYYFKKSTEGNFKGVRRVCWGRVWRNNPFCTNKMAFPWALL